MPRSTEASSPKKSAGQQMLDSLKASTPPPSDSVEQPAVVETPVVDAAPQTEVVADTAPVGQVETAQQQPTAAPDFLTTIRDLGFADVKDEADARARLLDAYRQQNEQYQSLNQRVTEIEPLANYGREYLETLRKPQARQQETQPAADVSPKWWNPPKVDTGLVQKYRVTDPATGEAGWSRETPAPVRAAADSYTAYMEEWQNKILYHPDEALADPIRRGVQEVLAQVFGVDPEQLPERLDLNGERRLQDTIMQQYGERLYAKDPVTNQLDVNRLTPYGNTVKTYLQEATEMQIPSPEARWKYALRQAEAEHRPSPTAVAQTKREENRRDVQRRSGATGLPDRSGSQPQSTNGNVRPQNKNLTAGQRLVERLEGLST